MLGDHDRPPRKGMEPEEVAVEILDAAWKNKREVVLTFREKIVVWSNKIFPSLWDFLLLRSYQQKLKAGISSEDEDTGAKR
jgi:short-subunit dehydrogenase